MTPAEEKPTTSLTGSTEDGESAGVDARERQVTDAFVALTDSLVGEFDLVELLSSLADSCARLLNVDAAGLLLADAGGVLHVLAASSDSTGTLQLLQLQRDQGPCLVAYRTGKPVHVPDLSGATNEWPRWAAAASDQGVMSAHALPMQLQNHQLGALGLFSTSPGELTGADVHLGTALAHVASVAIMQDKALSDRAAVAERLQSALTSRVVLEQAKGVLAQHGNLTMNEAFAQLRGYARENNQRLTEVARAVVGRRLLPAELLGRRHPPTT